MTQECNMLTYFLFRNVTEGAFYLIAYAGFPAYSLFQGFNNKGSAFLFVVFSSCVALVMDCYSKYSTDCSKSKLEKLYFVGGVYFVLSGYTYFDMQYCIANNTLALNGWPYLALSVAPIAAIKDIKELIIIDRMSRTR